MVARIGEAVVYYPNSDEGYGLTGGTPCAATVVNVRGGTVMLCVTNPYPGPDGAVVQFLAAARPFARVRDIRRQGAFYGTFLPVGETNEHGWPLPA